MARHFDLQEALTFCMPVKRMYKLMMVTSQIQKALAKVAMKITTAVFVKLATQTAAMSLQLHSTITL